MRVDVAVACSSSSCCWAFADESWDGRKEAETLFSSRLFSLFFILSFSVFLYLSPLPLSCSWPPYINWDVYGLFCRLLLNKGFHLSDPSDNWNFDKGREEKNREKELNTHRLTVKIREKEKNFRQRCRSLDSRSLTLSLVSFLCSLFLTLWLRSCVPWGNWSL